MKIKNELCDTFSLKGGGGPKLSKFWVLLESEQELIVHLPF